MTVYLKTEMNDKGNYLIKSPFGELELCPSPFHTHYTAAEIAYNHALEELRKVMSQQMRDDLKRVMLPPLPAPPEKKSVMKYQYAFYMPNINQVNTSWMHYESDEEFARRNPGLKPFKRIEETAKEFGS